jgi:hypothetical protein
MSEHISVTGGSTGRGAGVSPILIILVSKSQIGETENQFGIGG